MSQIGQFLDTTSGAAILTLTGDVGGAIVPDGVGNIDILGGTGITTTGNPGTNTLTIDLAAIIATSYLTDDANSAIPALNVLTVAGGTNMGTTSAGSTVTINLDDAISLTTVTATTFYTDVAAAGLTLSGTTLEADGTDADIDINITAKGTGQVIIDDLQLTTPLEVTEGGTGLATLTDHSVLVGSGTAAITPLAVGATGETIMGSTGADPGWTDSPSFGGSVTAGTGLTVTTGNLNLPDTVATGSSGVVNFGGIRFISNYGTYNTFVGEGSGSVTAGIGGFNTAVGFEALKSITSGTRNAILGDGAGESIDTGDANILLGTSTGGALTSAVYNTFLGKTSGYQVTTGSYNVMIGTSSGSNADGTGYGAGNSAAAANSSNIYICSDGAAESNTIRIGTNGSGDKQQDTTYVAGIYGVTPGGTQNIALIDSNHQLGSVASLTVPLGGTGVSSITDHSLIVGSGTGAITELGAATDGQIPIGSTGADPVLGNIAASSNILSVTNGAGSISLDVNDSLKTSSGFHSWSGGAPYFDDTTIGSFTISQAGTGYIKGVEVTWTGGQTITGLVAGTAYLIYIDSTGTIGKDSTFDDSIYCDNIVLFECVRDSTTPTNNQLTVKENHPYNFPCPVARYLNDTVGTIIENINNGANITLNGTQKIEISGADVLSDDGLYTDIPDSGGTAETFFQMYANGSGKWALHSLSDTFDGYYNNAGTPTAISVSKYAVYSLYISKDDLNAATPKYGAVLDTSQYNNLTSAQTAIANGTIAKPSGELEKLETALLGYIIYSESSSSIVDVLIEKTTLRQTVSTGGTNDASLITTNVTNFNGILSASDTNVQSALETIDDWGASTTNNALLVGNGTGSPIGSLAVGTTGVILQGSTGNPPAWSTATYPSTAAIGDVLVASAANVIGVVTGAATAGYVLTANGAGTAPTFQAATSGTVTSVTAGTNLSDSGTATDPIIDLDAAISGMTGITMADTGSLQTTTVDTDTMLIQGYDVDGTAYVPFITITNANDPTCDLNTGVTIGTKYIYRADGTDVPVADGGTGASTLTDHGVLFGSGTSAITASAALTNGQLLVGSTGNDPSVATLTEGVGIDITNAAGSITVASTGTTLNDQTGTTYTLVLGDAGKHITFTNAAAITVTVPTNAAVAFPIGTVISFSQGGAGQVTFAGAGPPTLQSADSALTTVKIYSGGCMIKILTDTWRFFGDLEA